MHHARICNFMLDFSCLGQKIRMKEGTHTEVTALLEINIQLTKTIKKKRGRKFSVCWFSEIVIQCIAAYRFMVTVRLLHGK